jgi:FkbM family methyltransferase
MLMRELARTTFASALHRLTTVKVGHRISDSRFAAWVCGEGPVVANLRYGAKAIVSASDYVGRSMYLWGEHDPRISAVLRAVLREGDTVLDIGANFGVTGILSAKLVGDSGTVHLFEPQPFLASCLRTSLLINGYSNAQVHECALSNHNGVQTMTIVDPSNMGMTTLSAAGPGADGSSPTIDVQIRDASEYVAGLNCSDLALVKIDVEGHEAIILSSLREWLSEKRVPVMIFECHIEDQSFQEHDTVKILSGLGYDFYGFDMRPYWQTQLNAVEKAQNGLSCDFVAVRWQELDMDRRNALETMIGHVTR